MPDRPSPYVGGAGARRGRAGRRLDGAPALAGRRAHGILGGARRDDRSLQHPLAPRAPHTAARPKDASARPPLLVFLHGRGSNGTETHSNAAFYEALGKLGDRAPAVVFPAGGEASYWHRRASGDWARYVLDEVIPQAVRRLRADPRRVAIGGVSMGGYWRAHYERYLWFYAGALATC